MSETELPPVFARIWAQDGVLYGETEDGRVFHSRTAVAGELVETDAGIMCQVMP